MPLPPGVHRKPRNRGLSLPAVHPPPLSADRRRSTFFGGWPSKRKVSSASCREKRDFFRKYGPLGNSFTEGSAPKADEPRSQFPGYASVLDPTGSMAHWWLSVVALAVSYFAWSVIFRAAFPSVQEWLVWRFLDGLFYCVYIADLLAQSRTSYLQVRIYSHRARTAAGSRHRARHDHNTLTMDSVPAGRATGGGPAQDLHLLLGDLEVQARRPGPAPPGLALDGLHPELQWAHPPALHPPAQVLPSATVH